MALFPPRHPLLRQPSHLARINPRHWLARDLVFAHSGYGAFVFGRPVADAPSALRSNALTGTQHPALVSARGWVPDASTTETYMLGYSGLPLPLTLSAWHYGVSGATNDGILQVWNAATDAGVQIRRSTAEVVTARAISSGASLATATGGYSSGRWQHGVAVFASTTDRTAYADGGNAANSTATRGYPSDVDRVIIAVDGTAACGTNIHGIALPIVMARSLDAGEVARLHEEQRSNPWSLFTERPIWVPVSSGGGGGFNAAWARQRSAILGAGMR